MIERYKKIWAVLSIVSLAMLAHAFIEWPADVYQALRVVISASAFFGVWLFYRLRKLDRVWIFAIIGIIFNPVAVFSLSIDTWRILYIVAVIAFSVSLLAIKDESFFNKKQSSTNSYALLFLIGLFLQILTVTTRVAHSFFLVGFTLSVIGLTILAVERIKYKWLKVLVVPIIVISWILVSTAGLATQFIAD